MRDICSIQGISLGMSTKTKRGQSQNFLSRHSSFRINRRLEAPIKSSDPNLLSKGIYNQGFI
jgi:hypothetical protein